MGNPTDPALTSKARVNALRDSAANWTATNPVLGLDVIGVEADTGKTKLGDGVTAWNALDYFAGGGPKVYKALLSQTSTNDPVVTVLVNTLGGEVVWARTGMGLYTGTLTGAFPFLKTIVLASQAGDVDDPVPTRESRATRVDNDTIVVTTGKNEAREDDFLDNYSLSVEVYP